MLGRICWNQLGWDFSWEKFLSIFNQATMKQQLLVYEASVKLLRFIQSLVFNRLLAFIGQSMYAYAHTQAYILPLQCSWVAGLTNWKLLWREVEWELGGTLGGGIPEHLRWWTFPSQTRDTGSICDDSVKKIFIHSCLCMTLNHCNKKLVAIKCDQY